MHRWYILARWREGGFNLGEGEQAVKALCGIGGSRSPPCKTSLDDLNIGRARHGGDLFSP